MVGDMGSIGKMLGMLGCLLFIYYYSWVKKDLEIMLENNKVLKWSKKFKIVFGDNGGIKRMSRDVE